MLKLGRPKTLQYLNNVWSIHLTVKTIEHHDEKFNKLYNNFSSRIQDKKDNLNI